MSTVSLSSLSLSLSPVASDSFAHRAEGVSFLNPDQREALAFYAKDFKEFMEGEIASARDFIKAAPKEPKKSEKGYKAKFATWQKKQAEWEKARDKMVERLQKTWAGEIGKIVPQIAHAGEKDKLTENQWKEVQESLDSAEDELLKFLSTLAGKQISVKPRPELSFREESKASTPVSRSLGLDLSNFGRFSRDLDVESDDEKGDEKDEVWVQLPQQQARVPQATQAEQVISVPLAVRSGGVVFERAECKQALGQKEAKYLKKLEELPYLKEILTEDMILNHLDFVEFLFESDTIFFLASFRHTSEADALVHTITTDEQGNPAILFQGAMRPWSYVKTQIRYDSAADKLVSVNDPQVGWNYLLDKGFVQRDRFEYTEIYPIGKVSHDDYQILLEHGKKFYLGNHDKDPSATKDHVFQIVTSYRPKFYYEIPDTWYAQNARQYLPKHITFRMVDKEGNLYSFGIEPKPDAFVAIKSALPFSMLTTTDTKISTPDIEERKDFVTRTATSIAVSEADAKAILQEVSRINNGDTRFNYMKQPCSKLASHFLQMLEVPVDTRTSLSEISGYLLPSLEHIPFIGRPLRVVVDLITSVANAIVSCVIKYIPEFVQTGVSFVAILF